jgi:hypothetical protein
VNTGFERLRDTLTQHGSPLRQSGPNWTARCPGHDDRNASLSVGRSEGMALVHCHAGCDTADVLAVLGLTLADLFDNRSHVDYVYRHADGTAQRKVRRTPEKQFWQREQDGTPPILYGLPEVVAAVEAGQSLYLVEGEKDCHSLANAGVLATTAPMGSGSFGKVDVEPLRGAHVTAIVDRDEAGDRWAETVRTRLAGLAARLRFQHAVVGKDATDHLMAGHGVDDFVPYQFPEPRTDETDDVRAVDVIDDEPRTRLLDLGPWLDGTHKPPEPSVGAFRDDGRQLLYAGLWHTVIAPTTAGKSWWALWHAYAEMHAGNSVLYCHFEEHDPGGMLERLRLMGCDRDQIRKLFMWVDCDRSWRPGEFTSMLALAPTAPTLVVLDGINAACGKHGWNPEKAEAIGEYRARFSSPAGRTGAAVLSLGHPVKARDRQDERHGFGGAGWLDEVTGVSFRLLADRNSPIRRGHRGTSHLWTVKDRHGQVERHGSPDTSREGWLRAGTFAVDNTIDTAVTVEMAQPVESPTAGHHAPDPIDRLGDEILKHLSEHGGRFASKNDLGDKLKARGVRFSSNSLAPALERLAGRAWIVWPEVGVKQSRPGWLSDPKDPSDQLEQNRRSEADPTDPHPKGCADHRIRSSTGTRIRLDQIGSDGSVTQHSLLCTVCNGPLDEFYAEHAGVDRHVGCEGDLR